MSSCCWLRVVPSLTNGVGVVNSMDDTKFEAFTKRIINNIDTGSADIFTREELNKLQKIFKLDEGNVALTIKTIQYLLKRMLKFVFKPVHLRNDLLTLGLGEAKADLLVKLWSLETKSTLTGVMTDSAGKETNLTDIKWELSTELSSDVAKKSKVAKACLTLGGADGRVELTHEELYALFLQLESVQTELDNIM